MHRADVPDVDVQDNDGQHTNADEATSISSADVAPESLLIRRRGGANAFNKTSCGLADCNCEAQVSHCASTVMRLEANCFPRRKNADPPQARHGVSQLSSSERRRTERDARNLLSQIPLHARLMARYNIELPGLDTFQI